MIFTMHLEL